MVNIGENALDIFEAFSHFFVLKRMDRMLAGNIYARQTVVRGSYMLKICVWSRLLYRILHVIILYINNHITYCCEI